MSAPSYSRVALGVGYEAIASVSGVKNLNGLSDGAPIFSAGWDFPGLLTLEVYYKKFSLENDIETNGGTTKAQMDSTMIGPLARVHHHPFIDGRYGLFLSKLESHYTLADGSSATTDQDGTHLGIL